MEEVWRSYGPLDPIGPSGERRSRRRRLAPVAAGVAAVCAAGAAAGLYLKPDMDRTVRATPSSAAEAPERSDDVSSPPGASLEAAELETQLQLAVADSAPQPMAFPAPGSPPGPAPALAPEPEPEPEPAAKPSRFQWPRLTLGRERTAPRPAPRQVSAPPRRAPQQPALRRERTDPAPLVIADATPTPRQFPRYAPPVPPRPVIAAVPEPVRTPPAPQPSRGSGPDCSGARTAADQMVCSSPDLAALDQRMQAEFAGAVAAGHNPGLLMRDQDDWRRRRDAAAPDPRAVTDAYQRRIGQLRSMQ